jgi:hypothetical protein
MNTATTLPELRSYSSLPAIQTPSHKNQHSSFIGRAVSAATSTICDATDAAANAVLKSVQVTVTTISNIAADTNTVATLYRKLEKHVIEFIEHVNEFPGAFGKMAGTMKKAVAFVDFVQLAGDVNYVVNQKYKEQTDEKGCVTKLADSNAMMAAHAAMATADAGGALLWMQELGFLNLSKTAQALGEVKLFSFVPKAVASVSALHNIEIIDRAAQAIGNFKVFGHLAKLSCLTVTLRALDLMYAFFALDAAQRIIKAPSTTHRTSASLDLSSYISELVLSALLLAGVTNIVGLGIAGTTCIVTALTSFAYRVSHQAELKKFVNVNV